MAARGMTTRDVLLRIISQLESKGFDETRKQLADLDKLNRRAFFGALSHGLKSAAGEAFRLLNPLNLIPKTLGVITGGFSLLGRVATTALGVAVGQAISVVTSSLAQLAQAPVLVAARVGALETVFWRIGHQAGYTREQLEGLVEGLKETGITTQQALSNLLRMIQANLDLSKATQLARVAQDAAVIAGVNSSEAFERLLHGITTLQPEVLRGLHIVVDMQTEIKRYADAHDIAAGAISATTKQQIALDAVLRAGATIAGSYESAMTEVGKKLGSLSRDIEECQLAIGRGFTPILGAAVDILRGTLKEIRGFFEKHRAVFEGFGDAAAEGMKTGWERAKAYLGEITGALLPDFDPQAWFQGGVDLVVNLADGLLTGLSDYVIPAVISIADVIASFLLGASPPKRGPLCKIIQGAIALMETYMTAFGQADYGILDRVLGPIEQRLRTGVTLGEIGETEVFGRIAQVRAQVAEIIAAFGETGAIPTEKMAELAQLIGVAGDQYARLLELHLQFKAATEKVEQLEKQVAEAREAGFIPEALKEQLAAAEQERDEVGKRVQLAELELRQRQRNVDLMGQYQQLMGRLAKQVERVAVSQRRAAKATEESTDVASQLAKAVGELPQKIDEARQKWKETFLEMFSSFSRLETPLAKLGDFVKGFIGFYSPEEQRQMQQFGDDVSEGYRQGEKARETFNLLVEGIKALPGKVGEWIAKLQEVQTWFEGLPPWIQDVLKGALILAAVNVATGGMVTGLTTALISVGLALGPLGWALTILATLILTNKEELQRWFAPEGPEESRTFQMGAVIKTSLYNALPEGTIKEWYDRRFMVPMAEALAGSKEKLLVHGHVGIRDPLVAAAQEATDAIVGHSIIPEMVTSVIQWLTQLKTRAITLLTQLKTQAITLLTELKAKAIQLFTEIKTKVTQLIADMVQEVLDSLIELRDNSEEILEATAVIFETMADRMGEAVREIKDEIGKLLKDLDRLIQKAEDAKDAMEDAGLMGESPSRFELGLRGIADAMRDLPSLTVDWTRTLNVQAMPVPAVAMAGGGTTIYLMVDRFEFPAIRSARDAGDFWAEIQAQTERATARAHVPGGVG